jgi:hypothetical protein
VAEQESLNKMSTECGACTGDGQSEIERKKSGEARSAFENESEADAINSSDPASKSD